MKQFLCAILALAITGQASFYGLEQCRHNPDPRCPTADGSSLYELERKGESYAATWKYPLGTKIKVTNEATGRYVISYVRDRGPNPRFKDRIIDLDRRSFSALANPREGIVRVTVSQVEELA